MVRSSNTMMFSKYKTEASLSSLEKLATGVEKVRLNTSAVRRSSKCTKCIRDKKLMHTKLKTETNSIRFSNLAYNKIIRMKKKIKWRDQV